MSTHRNQIPPHLQRGLLVLIVTLMLISVARFFVTMHRQEERIEVLEAQVDQLMADTTRLRIPAYPHVGQSPRNDGSSYRRPYARSGRSWNNKTAAKPKGDANDSTSAEARTADGSTTRSAFISTQAGDRPRKFTEPHLFDINTIDSLTLIRIPGIAARTASVILKYRQRYGGFYDPWQLQEFLTWDAARDYMEEWCTAWFTADASRLRAIHVNAATISELQRHPYISHEQAVEIVRYRTRHKRITAIEQFQQLPSFSAEQIQQILPYLAFD